MRTDPRVARRWLRLLLCCFAVVLGAAPARAAVGLCLAVRSEGEQRAGFEELVRSEVARHRSHELSARCETRLLVELFHVASTRYLKVRVDGEIPIRNAVNEDAALEARLKDAISRALHSDPAYLAEDPSRLSSGERTLNSLVHGHNSYRISLFEAVVRTDTGGAFAPGVGFELARGANQVQVWARSSLAGSWSGVAGSQRALRLLGGLDAGLNYELSPRAAASGYAGLGAGLVVLRFEGRLDPEDAATLDRLNTVGAVLELRLGARFFRLYDFDCDVFALGALPLFATKNPDAQLFGDGGVYTPFAQLGVAVGF